MAEIISGDLDSRDRYASHPERYPWPLWLDGLQRKLVKGEDFGCAAHTFRQLAYERASLRGLKVRTKIAKDGLSLRLQAYKPGVK